ncbi:MAG: hypothetical protein ACHQ2Y_02225 [Candidatus Lutacidiplasmatales archaeon]
MGAKNVTVKADFSWKVAAVATSGSRSGRCDEVVTYTGAYNATGWNGAYNATTNTTTFPSFNETWNDTTNGSWGNRSYGATLPPGPFHLNNTTTWYHYRESGQYGLCHSTVSVALWASALLIDTTTGRAVRLGGSSVGVGGTLFSATLEVTNYTDWFCDSAQEWYGNGPNNNSGSWPTNFNYPWTCTSLNWTLSSLITVYAPTASSTSGTLGHVNWSSSGVLRGAWWWTPVFRAGHHYAIQIGVQGAMSASSYWRHGGADWAFDFATLGRGFRLSSITVG